MQLQHLPTSLCLLRSLAIRHSVSRQLSTSPSLHKEQFVRDKVNLNVVTLGAAQHGKTWLASELSRALAAEGGGVAVRTPEMIDHSASEREHGRSEHASHLELWRRDSRYRLTLADLPGHAAYARNLLNHLAHADAALLVVSPDLGVEPATALHCHLAAHLGVAAVVAVVGARGHTDQETLELVREELGELQLDPVILDPQAPALASLLHHLETVAEQSGVLDSRDPGKPFHMALEQVGNIPSRGLFCAGRVLQGSLAPGTSVEVFCQGRASRAAVREMEIFRRVTDSLVAGDRGGVFLKLKQDIEIKRGAVIYDVKSKYVPRDQLEVGLQSILGPRTIKGDSVLFHSTSTDGKVTVVSDNPPEISDGGQTMLKLKLSQKILAKPGDPFVLRNNQNYYKGIIMQ